MDLVVNDHQLQTSLDENRAGKLGGAVCRLFTNDVTPTRTSVAADFTEAAWSGYSAVPLLPASWSAAAQDGQGRWFIATNQAVFTNISGAPQTAYGGFATDPDDASKVLFASRFGGGVVIGNGTGLQWRVTYRRTDAPADSLLLLDTFTGANGELLTAHLPEAGGPWQMLASAVWDIQSNAAHCNTGGNTTLAVVDLAIADHETELEWTSQNGADNGIVVRLVDQTNHWLAAFGPSAPGVVLYEVVAGAYTVRGSGAQTWTAGVTYTVAVRCEGTTISVLVDGVTVVSYATATAHQTATKVGMRCNFAGTQGAFLEIQANRL